MPNNALLRRYDVHQSTTGNDNKHASNDVICLWRTRGMQINKRRTDHRIKLKHNAMNKKKGDRTMSQCQMLHC